MRLWRGREGAAESEPTPDAMARTRALGVLTGMGYVMGFVNQRVNSVPSYTVLDVGPGDPASAILDRLGGPTGTSGTSPAASAPTVDEPLAHDAWLAALHRLVGYPAGDLDEDDPDEAADEGDADIRIGGNDVATGNVANVFDRQLAAAVGDPKTVRRVRLSSVLGRRISFIGIETYLVEGPDGRILFHVGWSD